MADLDWTNAEGRAELRRRAHRAAAFDSSLGPAVDQLLAALEEAEGERDAVTLCGSASFTSDHICVLPRGHNMPHQMEPPRSMSYDAQRRRADAAEALVRRLAEETQALVSFYECVMQEEPKPLEELAEVKAILAAIPPALREEGT